MEQTIQTIIERVKGVEDAFAIAGTNLEEIISPSDTKDEAAYKVLKTVIKVLNEDWVPDLKNRSQDKYYPWFKPSTSGSGLSYDDFGDWSAGTLCGVRLCYRSYEIMMHGVVILEKYYNDFLS